MTSIEHVGSALDTFRRDRSHADRAAIVEEIRMLELAWRNAIVSCDLAELGELWTGDYSLTAPDGRSFSRAQCLGAVDERVVRIERCEPERPAVHVHSDVAVIVRGRARV